MATRKPYGAGVGPDGQGTNMSLLPHTCRRAGTYHFRIRIPRDLVARFQQQELKASLRTKNFRAARTRSILATQHCLRLFEFVRRDVMLRPDQIRELAQSHFRALLEQDVEQRRLMGSVAAFDALPVEQRLVALDQRRRQLACQDFGEIAPRVSELLREAGVDVSPEGPEFQRLCTVFLRAEFSAIQCQQQRDQGIFYGEPEDPLFRQIGNIGLANGWDMAALLPPATSIRISTVQEADAHGLTELALKPLSEVLEIIVKARGLDGRGAYEDGDSSPPEAKPGKKTVAPKYRAVVRALIAVAGDKPIYQYRRIDIIKLKKMLMKTPANYTQKRFESIVHAVEANEKAVKKMKLLATNTINDGYLTYIDQVFQYAYDNGGIIENIAAGIRVEADLSNRTPAVEVREPFEVAEFNRIYAAPLYVGAESSHYWHNPGQNHFDRGHRFWTIPAIQFGGFRPQEFGQVHLADITEIDDYPCIEITNKIDKEDYIGASEELIKKIKTSAARRTVPVHPVLIALGLLEYIEEMRARSEVRLFPKLKAASDGTFSSTLSKEFNADNRFLDRLGLKSDTKCLYGGRHSFKDALRQGDFSDRDQDYLMGHANHGVSETYGSRKIFAPLIDKFLKHLHYPDLDLSKIMDGPGRPAFSLERLKPTIRRRLERLQVDLGMYLPK